MADISAPPVLTAVTVKAFNRVNPKAGALMMPTVAWVAYSAGLNASLSLLTKNPDALQIEGAVAEEAPDSTTETPEDTADATCTQCCGGGA